MSEIFIVLIINKKFVRWESFEQSATLGCIFNLLTTKYNITKCVIEIGDVSFMNKHRFKNMALSNILLQANVGTIYVFTKEQLLVLNSE